MLAAPGTASAALDFAGAAPNPSRGPVRFAFSLGAASPVRVSVLDLAGRAVRVLDAGNLGAGAHVLGWDGHDDAGRPVPAGIYFASLEAGGARQVRKVAVLSP
jgi:flagellar hook assembly protein FlgD